MAIRIEFIEYDGLRYIFRLLIISISDSYLEKMILCGTAEID